MASAIRIFVRNHVYGRIKRWTAAQEIASYLASTQAPKLNLGAGGNRLPGWLNVDLFPPPGVVFLDGAKTWPFETGTFDAILCEHMIEHVPKEVGARLIQEAYRCLRPGGALRVVTPDLTVFAKAVVEGAPELESYLTFLESFVGTTKPNWCDAINLIFYEHGHRFIYTSDELARVLTGAGFRDIAQMRGGHYGAAVFQGVDGHPKLVGEAPNEIEAFALEARKASAL